MLSSWGPHGDAHNSTNVTVTLVARAMIIICMLLHSVLLLHHHEAVQPARCSLKPMYVMQLEQSFQSA